MQEAFQYLVTPTGILLVLFGTGLGVFVGAIPGLTGTMLIALTLPLTYGADPQAAMTLLISIYVGAISGGMIVIVWVSSKIMMIAVIGAWVVAATTAPIVTSA